MEVEEVPKTKNQLQLTSAVDLFGKSYAIIKRNLNIYGLVYAIPAAMVIASVIQLAHDNQRQGWGWSHAFSSSFLGPNFSSDSTIQTASAIMSMILFFGAIISYLFAVILNLRAAQGKKPSLGSLWNELKQSWLWLKLLGLGFVTIMFLVVGFVLLIVPGVILLWRLFLAPYILVDQNTSISDAINGSWKMTGGRAWPIYSIMIFSFVLALTGVIPIIGSLISFVLGVAYAAAPALRYQELKKLS